MAEWTLNGNKELEASLSLLSSPDEMYEDYKEYRIAFGDYAEDKFTVSHYLKVLDIHAKYMIAKAIFDHPEFFSDQLFKAFNSGQEMKVNINGDITTYKED